MRKCYARRITTKNLSSWRTNRLRGNKDRDDPSCSLQLEIEINAVHILIAASGGGGSMLVPPVAQGGTVADRPVGDTVARAQQTTTGTAATTTLWPLAPAQPNQVPNQQAQGIPPLAATPAPAHNQGSHYVVYIRVCVCLSIIVIISRQRSNPEIKLREDSHT